MLIRECLKIIKRGGQTFGRCALQNNANFIKLIFPRETGRSRLSQWTLATLTFRTSGEPDKPATYANK